MPILRYGVPTRVILVCLFAFAAGLWPVAAPADVTGAVLGRVTVEGAPQAGVRVTVAGESTTASTQTDASGNFAFGHLAFGRYHLTAHAGDKPDASAEVVVGTDSVTRVDLAIGGVREIGRARATGRGVGGNPVSVTTIDQFAIAALPQNQRLDRLIETVPGVVRFSYDEPVVHGFHGISYEIDGAPVPQNTATNFSEILDPRNIDSLEIFTGAFPAEFGGGRSGAVVNILTKRDVDIPNGSTTVLSPGDGTYGTGTVGVAQATRFGTSDVFVNANLEQTNRGIDSPAQTAQHDRSSLADAFLRTITRLGAQDTLSFDYSNQYSTFQIPINTVAGADQIVNLPWQDDVQRENTTFGNLNYTHSSRDGSAYVQVIPWFRTSRIVYAGDLAADVQALDYGNAGCGADGMQPCPLAGLAQDRRSTVAGVRAAYFHATGSHAFKAGIEGAVENFTSTETIVQAAAPAFFDNVARRGTSAAGYVQDRWTPSPGFSLSAGLRYDYSNGFVEGNQLQPRIGVNVRVAPDTIVHAYYGRLYGAPALEDTRREAVVIGGGDPNAAPTYDLKPQTESYYEAGIAHTFRSGLDASANAWQRNVWNVLDTTQIYPTPIFAVYNNALGVAHGYELRLEQRGRTDSWYLSAAYSQSLAGGISGGTFIFCPPPSNTPGCLANLADPTLQPEDHDQSVAISNAYTKHFGRNLRNFVTVGSDYGTGYPVQFQNGPGRLTPHLTFDVSAGRAPGPHSLGYSISALNVTGYQYLIKVNNGFNSTQWSPGVQLLVQVRAAF